MIEFRNVQAGRQGTTFFKDFNWRIQPGENWLIQGENGSGKTLLLELLAGKLHPTAGELRIDFIAGRSWDERYAQRKQLIHHVPTHAVQSLLKQDQHQYYQQRYFSIGDQQQPMVKDVLGDAGALAGLNLPAEFSIDDLWQVEVNRLSNGQLKKLLLIKVLLTGIPRLLLLDYPFEGLDKASRRSLCNFIDYLIGQHGVQVVIIDQHNEVPKGMNRVLHLKDFQAALAEPYPSVANDDFHNVVINETQKDPEDRGLPRSPKREERRASPTMLPAHLPIVEVVNLRIQYGEHVILKDFSWRVNRGERWALIGKNGAGKTTLFSMIFADHPMAYSQNVSLFGRRRGTGESIWEIKRRISYLGPEQLSYLSPSHIQGTAREYLLHALKRCDPDRLDHLTVALGAREFLDLPVRILSSGQLQVILIIQCLLAECELLLLDEPFQFLDIQRKTALNRVLNNYLDENKTLILITHYADDLAQWTNHTKQL